jgi:hypothetical protein
METIGQLVVLDRRLLLSAAAGAAGHVRFSVTTGIPFGFGVTRFILITIEREVGKTGFNKFFKKIIIM